MEGKIIQLPYGIISEKNDPETSYSLIFHLISENIFYLTSYHI